MTTEYQAEFYIEANGISREVITTDICRFLGSNARVVRPHYDPTGTHIVGYYYVAYRSFTDNMIRTLQENSVRWAREKDRNVEQTGHAGSYVTSDTQRLQAPVEYGVGSSVQSLAVPEVASSGRFIEIPERNLIFDRHTGQYFAPTNQPISSLPSPGNSVPRYLPGSHPANPPIPPAGVVPDEYWTVDPATGRGCYVRNGRIVQWA